MTRAQRVYLAVCAGSIGFTLAYVLVDYAKIPRPFYDPLARTWRIAARVPGVAMGYVGLWLYALVAGAVIAAAAWLLAGVHRGPLAQRSLGLLGAWTGTAWMLAAAYYVWNNWP